ncbi:MAG: hypothetical protein GC204_21520 [Chloroflexi bacterium]|nr:hypothetical protein [Chloroflexota bacterium]
MPSITSPALRPLRFGIAAAVVSGIALILTGLVIYPTTVSAAGILAPLAPIAILVIYVAMGISQASVSSTESLRIGVRIGLMIGFWFIASSMFEYVVALDISANQMTGLITYGIVLLLFVLAGALGTRPKGQLRDGIAAALWSAVIGGLFWFLITFALLYLFRNSSGETNVQTLEMADDFRRSGMTDYDAFVMSDYFGAGFFHMLLLPFIAAVLGTFGGGLVKLWRALSSR